MLEVVITTLSEPWTTFGSIRAPSKQGGVREWGAGQSSQEWTILKSIMILFCKHFTLILFSTDFH